MLVQHMGKATLQDHQIGHLLINSTVRFDSCGISVGMNTSDYPSYVSKEHHADVPYHVDFLCPLSASEGTIFMIFITCRDFTLPLSKPNLVWLINLYQTSAGG